MKKDSASSKPSRSALLLNRIMICPFCVYKCKGQVNLNLKWRATKNIPQNWLICADFT